MLCSDELRDHLASAADLDRLAGLRPSDEFAEAGFGVGQIDLGHGYYSDQLVGQIIASVARFWQNKLVSVNRPAERVLRMASRTTSRGSVSPGALALRFLGCLLNNVSKAVS